MTKDERRAYYRNWRTKHPNYHRQWREKYRITGTVSAAITLPQSPTIKGTMNRV